MNSFFTRALPATLLLLAAAGAAVAQFDYDPNCWDPSATKHYSDDFLAYHLEDDLFGAGVGISGTVGYKFCIPDASVQQVNVRGRFGFTIGRIGSIQDNNQGSPVDDFMRLSWAMNSSPWPELQGLASDAAQSGAGWSFARVLTADANGAVTSTLFGSSAMTTAFVGASDRYMFAQSTVGSVNTRLQIDVIGDSARVDWRLANTTNAPLSIGLWYGARVTLVTATGSGTSNPYITAPGIRPIYTGKRFIRTDDPAGFPNQVSFGLNQPDAYGLQVVNGPTPETSGADGQDSEQTPVDEFVIGDTGNVLNGDSGGLTDPKFNDAILPDTLNFNTAYIQKWQPQVVAAPAPGDPNSGVREIVSYYRSTSGVSNYARPYTVVADAPHVLSTDPSDPTVFVNNPFTVRVYVDNTRGFSQFQQEIPLNDVRVTLALPQGLTDANDPNKTVLTQTIPLVNPREIQSVDFQVAADPTVSGPLTYQVTVAPTPGTTKVLSGTILAASTPRLLIRPSANLVGSPWKFIDPSWETILGLTPDRDFQAFAWDAVQQQYVKQTQPERGKGNWVISTIDLGYKVLGGSPSQPTDTFPSDPFSGGPQNFGAPAIQIHAGWNLIADPYNYPIVLGQIVGASAVNPNGSQSWADLVSTGVVSGSLAYWDADNQTYKFIQGLDAQMVPNKGYWIFVSTLEDVTLQFPVVFTPFARSAPAVWTQSDRQWRLNLAVHSMKAADESTYVGQAKSTKDALSLRAYKPPVPPIASAVSGAVVDTVNGKSALLAQDLSDKAGSHEWTYKVSNKLAGPVTVTWPNIPTVPRGMKFRIVDKSTGASRDMRKTSGYTYDAAENTERTFTIQAQPGIATPPTIGGITISRTTRGPGSPLAITYTLTADATTTIRILQGNGREVFAATRGRADRAGQNTVVWNLRDASNRAVPPGSYNVELTAEGPNGERVRRIVPVLITR